MRALLLLLLATGCGVQTREARAFQPNPALAAHAPDELAASLRLYIHQRDQQLPRDYQLRNWAQFVVVARDRLRFHVGLVRYDEDEADTAGWTVWLEDETGKKLLPAAREVPRIDRIAISWRLYPYTPGDAWCREPPCLSRVLPGYTVFAGEADYVFLQPGILAPGRTELALVLQRGGVEYRYTWHFGSSTYVEHYGRSHVDDEMGTIVVPGPHTELAGTRYEWERWK